MTRSLIVALVIGLVYILLYNYLPLRTPITVASAISGLEIKSDAEVLYFDEHWVFTDGYVKVALKLSSDNAELVRSQTKKRKYAHIIQYPLNDSSDLPFTMSSIHSVSKYEQGKKPGNFSEVTWDNKNSILFCVDYM